MNPMNLIQMFKGIRNPKEAALQMLSNNTNPAIKNAVEMAKNGDNNGVKKIAENICKEKGIDFEKEFSDFMSNFK